MKIKYELVSYLKSNLEEFSIVKINHEILFALYHTALKQPEPLSRCVFLFRIIEYAYKYSQLDSNKPVNRKFSQYLEDKFEESKHHQFIPIYRKYLRKEVIENELHIWKSEAIKVATEWDNKSIKLGDEIYKSGRCGIAHGTGVPNSLVFHDYTRDYKRIIKINLVLELICRYLIERENLWIKNFVRIDEIEFNSRNILR